MATNSLELGIDIGDLDEVILIQSPSSIASALQRLGWAGHQVEATSRGVLFPTYAHDLMEAAVLVAGIKAQDIESAKPVECPLDVLSQVIVSMTGTEIWKQMPESGNWMRNLSGRPGLVRSLLWGPRTGKSSGLPIMTCLSGRPDPGKPRRHFGSLKPSTGAFIFPKKSAGF